MRKMSDVSSKSKNNKPFSISRWLKYMMIPNIIFLVITAYVLKDSLYTDSEAVVGYNEVGNVNYKVFLKENNYYTEGYLGSDMQYIASLIDTVNTSFVYEMHSQEKMEYTYKYNIKADLIITDPNDNNKILYKKNSVLVDDTEEKVNQASFRIAKDIDINYDEYNNYVNAFKKEYALSVKSRLVITMEVVVNGKSDVLKEDFNKTNKLVIAIPMSEQTINIGIDTSDIDNSGVLEKNYLSLIKKPLSLVLGIIVLILNLCLLYVSLYTVLSNRNKKDLYESMIKGIIREYDRAIVTSKSVDAIDFNNYRVIDVASIEELLDAHDSTEEPILYSEVVPDKESIFIIINDDILYRFVVNRKELEKEKANEIEKRNEYIDSKFSGLNIFKKKKK